MTARSRLPMIGGIVLFGYLLVWMLQLVLLYNSPESFDRAASWWASLAGRLVACGVLLAGVYHLLEGLRRTVRPGWTPPSPVEAPIDGEQSASPSADRSRLDGVLGVAVPLLTWAVVLPGWAVLLRPWLDGSGS